MKQFAARSKNKKKYAKRKNNALSEEGWMTALIERASKENERSVIRN